MRIHKSSVNFKNLITDLAEMYPFDISEVIVEELIANALDAQATRISIDYNINEKILTITDDGEGMDKKQFSKYHDFAAALKIRGKGIGFAGLGAKISFNIADRVITETKSKSFNGGSNWYLKSQDELIWEEITTKNIKNSGTIVKVYFTEKAEIDFKDSKDIVNIIKKHYLPLLSPEFLNLYEKLGIYSSNLRFLVNKVIIEPKKIREFFKLDNVKPFFPKKTGKKYGFGLFGLSKAEYPLFQDQCGVFLCTYGKVIKADLFKQFPGILGPRILGVVEVPGFIEYLTTSKTDFVRKPKGFRKLYEPIRKKFKDWLEEIGIESDEIIGTSEAERLERELRKIVEDVPELSDFFGFWMSRNVYTENPVGTSKTKKIEGISTSFPFGNGIKVNGEKITSPGDEEGKTLEKDSSGKKRASPISRKSKRGPKIAFVTSPQQEELSWIEGNNVIINMGHPSYKKASSNKKARRIFSLFAIASAIQKFTDSEDYSMDFSFIDKFMTAWGSK